MGKGKQERITDTIYDLFDHLTKDLEPHLVAFLVQKIRATRVFDAKTLNLMKTLTLNQLLEDDDNVLSFPLLQLPFAAKFSWNSTGSTYWRIAVVLGYHTR